MKKDYILGIFLLFSTFFLFAQGSIVTPTLTPTPIKPNQFPVKNTPSATDAIYSQTPPQGSTTPLPMQISFETARSKYFGALIISAPVSYIPTAIGNTNCTNCIVTSALNNKKYIIDPFGASTEISGGGNVNAQSLISNNSNNLLNLGTDNKLNVSASNFISNNAGNEITLGTDAKLFSQVSNVFYTYPYGSLVAPTATKQGDIWVSWEQGGKKFIRFWQGQQWVGVEVTPDTYENPTAPDPNIVAYRFWLNTAQNEVWARVGSSWVKIYPATFNPSQFLNSSSIQYSIVNGSAVFVVADNGITTNHLADNAVTSSKIQPSAVGTNQLADNEVTTAKITDNTITNIDLASDCIATDNIQDGTIQTNDIADLAVTTQKIADNSITYDKLDVDAVHSANILDETIENNDVANNTLMPSKFAPATNYADIHYFDGSSWITGPFSDNVVVKGPSLYKVAGSGNIAFDTKMREGYFDYQSDNFNTNAGYSYGNGVGLKLDYLDDVTDDKNALWKATTANGLYDYAKMTYSLLAPPTSHKGLSFERGIKDVASGVLLRKSNLSLFATQYKSWVDISVQDGGTGGFKIYADEFYATNIASGASTNVLYINPANGRVTQSAAPTGGVVYTQGTGISLASNTITNTATNSSNSIQGNGLVATPFKLVGDVPTPSISQYYGTNNNGVRGYYDLPSSASKVMVQVSKGTIQNIAVGQTIGIENWSNSLASNSNAAFNMATGVFTAPRTGFYYFSYKLKFGGVNGIFNESIMTTITTPQPNSNNFSRILFFQGGEMIPPTLENSCLVYLSSGQQVAIGVTNSTSNSIVVGQDLVANFLSIHEL